MGRSHSQKGLDGVTVVVQQASAVERVLEYPPKDLVETFQAVFGGRDPTDTRKAQQFPIHKDLFLRQHAFLQQYSKPNTIAVYDSEEVDKWRDRETPPVLQASYVDVPAGDSEENLQEPSGQSSTKCRGPVDATMGAHEP